MRQRRLDNEQFFFVLVLVAFLSFILIMFLMLSQIRVPTAQEKCWERGGQWVKPLGASEDEWTCRWEWNT